MLANSTTIQTKTVLFDSEKGGRPRSPFAPGASVQGPRAPCDAPADAAGRYSQIQDELEAHLVFEFVKQAATYRAVLHAEFNLCVDPVSLAFLSLPPVAKTQESPVCANEYPLPLVIEMGTFV